MEVIVKQSEENKVPKKYPWIGIARDGEIVIFTGNGEGIAIENVTSLVGPGGYSDTWIEDNFHAEE